MEDLRMSRRSLSLFVQESDGIARSVEIADGGVPLPDGYASDAEELVLQDGSLRPCAAQFRVMGRLGALYGGYLDAGWKDTVLLMPGERVRLMMRFADYDGLFLYHCHNLEHEDMGMMRNYYVRAA